VPSIKKYKTEIEKVETEERRMAEDVCNFSGQNQACKGFHSESA
jgi:hypothetical protein